MGKGKCAPLADAVATVVAGKIVKRDANGKIAGDITGNAATATYATSVDSATTATTATLATTATTANNIPIGDVGGNIWISQEGEPI